MLDLEFAELSDVGRVRPHNEDCLGHHAPASPHEARTRGWLFALADGVGGEDRGEVASSTAIETLLGCFPGARAGEPPSLLLSRLVQEANLRVYEKAATGPGKAMSTTLVVCLLRYDRATIAHVGDSRAYLIRAGRATPLTQDHTLVAEQVRMRLLTAEDAAQSEKRHLLSRSIGGGLIVKAELDECEVRPADILLLCSDGLHGSVTANAIAAVTEQWKNLHEAAAKLVSLACEKDGSDNISVQLIRIKEIERTGMYRGRPYKLR